MVVYFTHHGKGREKIWESERGWGRRGERGERDGGYGNGEWGVRGDGDGELGSLP